MKSMCSHCILISSCSSQVPIIGRPQDLVLIHSALTMILLSVAAGSRIIRRLICADWFEPDLRHHMSTIVETCSL